MRVQQNEIGECSTDVEPDSITLLQEAIILIRFGAMRYLQTMRAMFGICLLGICLLGVFLGAQDLGRLKLVVTAHQFGPVSYRDPLGVISPSGDWLAYSIAHRLFIQRTVGGPVAELPPCNATIRHLTWLPDDRTIVVDSGDPRARWWSYDAATRTRQALWPQKAMLIGKSLESGKSVEIPLAKLEQLVWSADNRKVAGVAHTATETELWMLNADGTNGEVLSSSASLAFPAWTPDDRLACLSFFNGSQRLSFPCGVKSSEPPVVAYGPVAFSPDGKQIYARSSQHTGHAGSLVPAGCRQRPRNSADSICERHLCALCGANRNGIIQALRLSNFRCGDAGQWRFRYSSGAISIGDS